MLERDYQKKLKNRLKTMFPGCIVYKTDPQQIQGSPDLLILYRNKWAALEVKTSEKASRRPNQEYRVKQMNDMSFAAIIFPENEEEVLNDLARLFET